MDAEIISIGDELTSGQRLDTNSQWLSERLGEIGIRVLYHTTVADDLTANVNVFRTATARADVVISTGGLGPTADDLTREVLAQLAGVELEMHDEIVEQIRALFARFGRDMPEKNKVQALFPRGSHIIPNPTGTAPGIAQQIARQGHEPCRVYALPGVPSEMFRMWEETVRPDLVRICGAPQVIRHRRIKCFGLSESELEGRLPDLIRRGRVPTVGITVSAATITLRITTQGASDEECRALAEPTVATIYDCLGEVVFGEEDDELEDAVLRLLRQHGLTLATAEWGTGGLLADRLHDAGNNEDENYLGGLVVPNQASLVRLLRVDPALIAAHTPVSGEVVEAMARGCREQSGADLALAVSQFPAAIKKDQTPQRLFLSLATDKEVITRSVPHFGSPDILKARAAKQALNLVRLALLDIR
jgi:nicotinamide-nucleotide amidase